MDKLIKSIKEKRSFLCVGLDVDKNKIPNFLHKEQDPIFSFNKEIIDATHLYAVAYKPNIAFYEAYGERGWKSLRKTIEYIKSNYPDIFTIADAKRGDIGNTSHMYARAFFEDLGFDSVTVAPYMGRDSVEPFLSYQNRYAILLALTSNVGAEDFQLLNLDKQKVYERVIETSQNWENSHRLMYVVGATRPNYLKRIRQIIPESFLLVPGVGAQGGSLEDVCKFGRSLSTGGLLINSSREIIYASSGADFTQQAMHKALCLQQAMSEYIQ